jgi:hypothetical protein
MQKELKAFQPMEPKAAAIIQQSGLWFMGLCNKHGSGPPRHVLSIK